MYLHPHFVFCSHAIEGILRYLNFLHIRVYIRHLLSCRGQRKCLNCASFEFQRISLPLSHAHTPILTLQWWFLASILNFLAGKIGGLGLAYIRNGSFVAYSTLSKAPSSGSGCGETRVAEDMQSPHVISPCSNLMVSTSGT